MVEVFTAYPAAAIAAAVILGLLVGSFLNVVIYRLPIIEKRQWKQMALDFIREEKLVDEAHIDETRFVSKDKFNLAVPRSRCPTCGLGISAAQNIPVLSWLLLKGKCVGCKTSIPVRYPLIEITTGLLTGYALFHFGFTIAAAGAVLLTWALICLTMIDADTYQLPDVITLPLLWLGILFNMFEVYTDLESAVIGSMAGYLVLWGVFWLFKLMTGKEGMGYGDFKLLAALGAWCGWQALPSIILISSIVGALIGIFNIVVNGRDKAKPIPFGPYLAIAGLLRFYLSTSLGSLY